MIADNRIYSGKKNGGEYSQFFIRTIKKKLRVVPIMNLKHFARQSRERKRERKAKIIIIIFTFSIHSRAPETLQCFRGIFHYYCKNHDKEEYGKKKAMYNIVYNTLLYFFSEHVELNFHATYYYYYYIVAIAASRNILYIFQFEIKY